MKPLHVNIQLFLEWWIFYGEVPEKPVQYFRVLPYFHHKGSPAPIFRVKLYLVTPIINSIRGQEAKKDPEFA